MWFSKRGEANELGREKCVQGTQQSIKIFPPYPSTPLMSSISSHVFSLYIYCFKIRTAADWGIVGNAGIWTAELAILGMS